MKSFRALIVLCCVSTAPVGNAQIVQPLQGFAPAGRRLARCDRQLPLPQLETGNGPRRAVVGDLDGDGNFDLVSANRAGSPGGITACLNRGKARFAPSTTYPCFQFSSAIDIALGDLDGDGDLDAATAGQSGHAVSIFFNEGDGTFEPAVVLTNGSTLSTAIQIADVDGDLDLDLAVAAREPDSVTVFRNDGRGGFTQLVQQSVLGDPSALLLVDMDADGDRDILTVNESSDTFSVRTNAGDGIFNLHQSGSIGVPIDEIAPGFLDGDGVRDFAVVSQANSAIYVVKYLGAGSFVVHSSITLPFVPRFVAVADMDGDSDRDLVVTGDDLAVLTNDGLGFFTIDEVYSSSAAFWSSATIADLDGDGDRDVAATDSYNGANNLTLFLNDGDGKFPMPRFQPLSPFAVYPSPAALADLDGDGALDMVTAMSGEGVSVSLNQGDGTFAPHTLYSAGAHEVTVADFDGDGAPDFAASDAISVGNVVLRLNQGNGTFGSQVSIPANAGAWSIAAGDLDGDLDADFVTGGSSDVAVFLNQGGGTFASPVLYDATGNTSRLVVLADVDGDQDRDLVIARFSTADVVVLRNQGDGTFAAPVSYPTSTFPSALAATDVDHDGDVDLVVPTTTLFTTHPLLVFKNQGNGSFVLATTYALDWFSESVAVRDVDGNGHPDVVLPWNDGQSPSSVRVLRNAGDGTFPERDSYGVYESFFGAGVAVGDLNADGRADIVASCLDGLSLLLTACH